VRVGLTLIILDSNAIFYIIGLLKNELASLFFAVSSYLTLDFTNEDKGLALFCRTPINNKHSQKTVEGI